MMNGRQVSDLPGRSANQNTGVSDPIFALARRPMKKLEVALTGKSSMKQRFEPPTLGL